jgi:hypothetical protein
MSLDAWVLRTPEKRPVPSVRWHPDAMTLTAIARGRICAALKPLILARGTHSEAGLLTEGNSVVLVAMSGS